jgi:hypothetical protein
MTASTKMLVSETGDQPEREREMGCLGEAGGWNVRGRVTVKSVVKDRKYEWEIDGMREDKKGNMKLKRDGITGHQCRYEGQSYRLKGKKSVKKGEQNCMSGHSKRMRVGSRATAKWERKEKYLGDCKTADEDCVKEE